MVMILVDEVLHTVGRSIFFKTYDTVKDLYGMHINMGGTSLEPAFLHIFPYQKGKFVVVDQLEQYYGIDLKGRRVELPTEEEEAWRSVIIKSSVCNCRRTNTQAGCRYCGGQGSIRNSFGIKLISSLLY
ncbi:hypothetical protein [Rufibacter tibetensis]|uniref:Uncharacterized protein n=1 Tax=Rufibacter tibetensis TaxID=512763 RepID=A0A0P0CPA3_9BACT|nr:hypothetical protein [Rufibacter tibetensis]ALI98099.1 hypothetical protein DC20_02785 [Rufibacter tibetensis]